MSDESTEEYKLFEGRKEEMEPVFARMKVDEDLYYLTPYKMMQLSPNQAKEMEDVINVTVNDPLVFVQKAIAVLCGATMSSVIKGRELTDAHSTAIEQLLADLFYTIDEALPGREISGMDAFTNEQVCVRGRLAARSCVRIDKETGLLTPDVAPLDTRFYVDDTDGKNMIWGAPWYRRSKARVEKEYSQPGDRPFTVEGSYAEVVDFWDYEHNIIYIDKQVVRERPNEYKEPPFISIVCGVGSSLKSEGAVSHQGESLLWLNRELWDEMNRCATILQTMNVNGLFTALQYQSSKGAGAGKPKVSPYKARTIHMVELGGGYTPISGGDINAATRLFYAMLEGRIQRGSISAIDYGTLTFPLSSLAITRLTGSRNDIFLPRVQAKSSYYQALSRMIINQCIALDGNLELGEIGNRNKYSKSDLEGEYSIKYSFFTDSAEQMIANLTNANAAQGFLSPDTIRREVLNLKDPDGEKVKWESAQAENVDEVLFLFRRGTSLLADKNGKPPTLSEKIGAKILAQRIKTILIQRRGLGELSPIEGKVEPGEAMPRGKPVVPLLAEGRGGGGGGAAPRETGTEADKETKSE